MNIKDKKLYMSCMCDNVREIESISGGIKFKGDDEIYPITVYSHNKETLSELAKSTLASQISPLLLSIDEDKYPERLRKLGEIINTFDWDQIDKLIEDHG